MVARLPTPIAVVDGLLLFARDSQRASTRAARARSLRPDLRALLVGRAVRRSTCAASRKILDFGDMDSQKWLEYARYKPFPLSLGYRLEGGEARARGEASGRQFDLVHRTTRAEMADAARATAPAWRPTGFRTASTRVLHARPTSRTIPTSSASSAAWTTTRTRNACSRFCAETSGRCCSARRPGTRAADRRRRSVAGDPRARRAARRDGHGLGARTCGRYVHASALTVAPLEIARGTQNKILEAMAMGVPVVMQPAGCGRRRRRARRAFAGRRHARRS